MAKNDKFREELITKATAAAFDDKHDSFRFGPSPLKFHPEMVKAVTEAVERVVDELLPMIDGSKK